MGGLLDSNCNPGAATPEMLHRIYAPRAAVSANPVLLREINGGGGGATTSAGLANGFIGNLTPGECMAEREALLPAYMRQGAAPYATGIPMARHHGSMTLPVAPSAPVFQPARRRAGSPPRGHFQAVNRDYAPLGASRSNGGGRQRVLRALRDHRWHPAHDGLAENGEWWGCRWECRWYWAVQGAPEVEAALGRNKTTAFLPAVKAGPYTEPLLLRREAPLLPARWRPPPALW